MSRRVLLIDDEDDIREIAAMSLGMVSGWEVLTASSGRQGFEIAKKSKPDAVLLDVMMPDLDGPGTFRLFQSSEDTSKIPVILLTAKVQAADHRQFGELGVAGIIAKPFDPLRLSSQVEKILHW